MAANSRLYPPIINYAMPAFASSSNSVRIYFALPTYDAPGDIASVHMTVRYQDSNENALKSTYGSRVKAFNSLSIDNEKVTQADKYYVELNKSDLASGFIVDKIYKIQLRFSSIAAPSINPTAAWLNGNYLSFSEWSTVCLIRPISVPTCTVLGLEGADQGAAVNYTSTDASFAITYSPGKSYEPLKAWRTILYNGTKDQILADSDWKNYTNYDYLPVDKSNLISFESILSYTMETGAQYVLQIDLITRNGYSISKSYTFTCYPIVSEDFVGKVTVKINEDEGYAQIHVISEDPYSTNIVLRRTSSESNFQIWEDIALETVMNTAIDWAVNDFTIESGIWYRYGVQTRDTAGRRGSLTTLSTIEMGEFDNAFLLEEGGRQLKLRFDFNISTANINISENKTDTIGSKFPYIRRNGTMYYRTFQCSGLITGFMDEQKLFTSPTELYHGAQERYAYIRDVIDQRVYSYDYTYEREFREKVQEFLYDDKIKLFKSLQEGNILIKLMNISLTPKNELGRLLYSFSAQAIEIDEATLANLQKYNIQPLAHYASSITFSSKQLGQLSNFQGYNKDDDGNFTENYVKYPAGQNIVHYIGQRFGWVYQGSSAQKIARNNIVVNDFNIHYLRFELESDPYLIYKSGDTLIPYRLLDQNTTVVIDQLILGWLIDIDNQTILVQPPNNIYELSAENLAFGSGTSISFPEDTQASIYYTVSLSESYDASSNIPVSLKYNTIIGQLHRTFEPGLVEEDVIRLLSKKHSFTDTVGLSKKIYSFNQLTMADIEAEPGTILYAKSSATLGAKPTQFVINENGNLLLQPNVTNAKIETLYFTGKQFDIRYLYPIYEWETIEEHTAKAISKFVEQHNCGNIKPLDPEPYDYYISEGQIYMYYNRKWCKSTRPMDYIWEIECPVTAIVNYEIRQVEGVYQ